MTSKTRLPMDMHNVLRECEVGTEHHESNVNGTVHRFMRPLIAELQRKRPSWEYIAIQRVMPGDGYYRFRIEDEGEPLGYISMTTNWRTSQHQYELENTRLESKRERRGNTITKDLKKAVKLIEQNYYGMTISEHAAVAKRKVESTVQDQVHTTRWDIEKTLRDAQWPLVKLLAKHPDVLNHLTEEVKAATTTPNKALIEKLAQLTDTSRTYEELRTIQRAQHNKEGTTVMLLRNKVYALGDELSNGCNFDDLAPHIAMGIGMLKLVEPKEYIAGVGMRIEPNVFFILPPGESTDG